MSSSTATSGSASDERMTQVLSKKKKTDKLLVTATKMIKAAKLSLDEASNELIEFRKNYLIREA
jgi:hypothetical protein